MKRKLLYTVGLLLIGILIGGCMPTNRVSAISEKTPNKFKFEEVRDDNRGFYGRLITVKDEENGNVVYMYYSDNGVSITAEAIK